MVDSKRDAAVALAKQGRRIFPLVPNGKTPALAGVDWRKTATTDPARVFDMWTCPVMEAELDFNIGIALDAGTLVVDVDVRDGKQGRESLQLLEAIYEPLPPTRIVRSASGGEHREYKALQPIGNSASKIGKNIDIKSEGGFVVAPGSVIDGVPYVLECDVPVAPVPAFVHTLAGEIKGRPAKTHDLGAADTIDTDSAKQRAIDYLKSKAPDHGTYAVAAKVKDFGISQELCGELLEDHWPGAHGKSAEHIEFRVANAYRYGTSAPGINAPEAEFDAVEIDEAKAPPARKSVFFTPFKLTKPDFEESYLIDDVLGLGTMAVTYGDSNVGKSFVAIDQAYHVAAGIPWNGCKVTQGMVAYVAAEGGKGFHKRLEALRIHHKIDDLPFALIPCPIDLQSERADTKKLISVIREAEAHYGQKCVLVVVDTLARVMGGGDENTSTDMSKFVTHCDRLREALGATVNIIHHTGKDKSKGARGSSALRAATDTEIEIEKGLFHVQKQRDLEAVKSIGFALKVVEVGQRADGKAVTACVVEWLAENEFSVEVSQAAADMLAVLERILDAKRDEIDEDENIPESNKPNLRAAVKSPWKEWQLLALGCLKGARGKALSRSNLFPLRLELSNAGKIKNDKSNQWFII